MKIRTLSACFLFAVAAKAQTKEAEFQKVQELLKKSSGIVSKGVTIQSQTFNEKVIVWETIQGTRKSTLVCSGIEWDRFDFDVRNTDDKNVAEVWLWFNKEADLTNHEDQKKPESIKYDEARLYIKSSDADGMTKQLTRLKMYTWKRLIEVRTADKAGLIALISRYLQEALVEEEGKLKSLTECAITLELAKEKITIPLSKIKVHETEDDMYVLCYNPFDVNSTTPVSNAKSEDGEHRELTLKNFFSHHDVLPLAVAIPKLAKFCKN